MKKSSNFVSIVIPIFCIAFALLYFHQTRDYQNFESVKFPYTIGVACIILFGIIGTLETKKWWKERKSLQEAKGPAPFRSLVATFRSKKWNPLYIVVLTVLYAIFVTSLNSIIGTYLYIIGLRFVFRKVKLKIFVYDLVAVILIFVVMHEVLLIRLPSGIVERVISRIFMRAF